MFKCLVGQKGPDDSKTLEQCRFVIGDYIDIAITPPSNNGMMRMMDRGNDRGLGGGGRRDGRRFRPY